jgi:hypothetical protein
MTINDPEGRYATTEQRLHALPDGRIVVHLARRFVPEPERLTVAAILPTQPGDRIDLFSARTIGVPTAWWRIADANRVIHPETLEHPVGQRLTIALPEAGQ